MNVKKTFWRPLGGVAMVLGGIALCYAALTAIHDRNEPLIGVFVSLVAIPALSPAIFGYFMWQGKNWAAWALRISIAGILLCGTFLDLMIGLDVFSLPQLAIPLILCSIIWLVISFF